MKAILCAIVLMASFSIASDTNWGYPYNAQEWGSIEGSVCDTGLEQSPIDLPFLSTAISQKKLDVNWEPGKISLIDTGHSLQLSSSTPLGNIVIGTSSYDLIKLQIHTRSEHTIRNKQYPMELQFIHQNSKGELAVLGLLCEQDMSRKKSKEEIFFQTLKACEQEPQTIDFSDILKTVNTKKYFQYSGSETTPGCDENIVWTVIADECAVPRNFLKWTKRFESMKQNYRSTQSLNGRHISGTILNSEENVAGCICPNTKSEATAFTMTTHSLTLLFGIGIGFVAQFLSVLKYLAKKEDDFEPLLHL